MLLSTRPNKINSVVSKVANYLPQVMESEYVSMLCFVGLFSNLQVCGKFWRAMRKALSFQCLILFWT
jgi:hypothetical protein